MAGMQIQHLQQAVSGYIIHQETLKKYQLSQDLQFLQAGMVTAYHHIGDRVGHQILMGMVLPKVGLQVHPSLIIARVL